MKCQLFEQHYLDELDGLLEPPLISALDAHKDGCSACQQLYEDARNGLHMVRRFMVTHEPPAALDQSVLEAAKHAMTKRSVSQELTDDTGGFFAWLNNLLASPSFRPALAFCAVAMLVGSVYVYQSKYRADLFSKKSPNGITTLKQMAPSVQTTRPGAHSTENGFREKGNKNPLKYRRAASTATKGTNKDTIKTSRGSAGSKGHSDRPKPRAAPKTIALAPTAKRAADRFGRRVRRRKRRKRRKHKRTRRSRRRYRNQPRRRYVRKPNPMARVAAKRNNNSLGGASLKSKLSKRHDPLNDSAAQGYIRKQKAKHKKGKHNRKPAPKEALRRDGSKSKRRTAQPPPAPPVAVKSAAAKRRYKNPAHPALTGSPFATPPPPMRRRSTPPRVPKAAMASSPRKMRPTRLSNNRSGRRANAAGGIKKGTTTKTRDKQGWTSLRAKAAQETKRGNTTQAIWLYQRAISKAKSRQKARLNIKLGALYLRRNDIPNAKRSFAAAIRDTPRHQRPQVYDQITRLYKWHGKYQNAARMLRRLMKLYPNRKREYQRALRRLPNIKE